MSSKNPSTQNAVAADIQRMQAHYDRHARQDPDLDTDAKQRLAGDAAPLRLFHNQIKKQLILRFSRNTDRLVDLACGRGGDMWKWVEANICYVKGLDLSPGEVLEAQSRYQNMVEKRALRGQSTETLCEFIATDQLGQSQVLHEPELFDSATCMFALHYFFITESSIKHFLQNVSRNLKDGGFFYGTFPLARHVVDLLATKGDARGLYQGPMITLKKEWHGGEKPFGSGYTFAIRDTVTEGHEGVSEGSHEYLTFGSVLTQLARQFDLHPVYQYHDALLESMLHPEDVRPRRPGDVTSIPVYKRFRPPYLEQLLHRVRQQRPSVTSIEAMKSDPTLAREVAIAASLEETSGLFVTFAFQKQSEAMQKSISENRGVGGVGVVPDMMEGGGGGARGVKRPYHDGNEEEEDDEAAALRVESGDKASTKPQPLASSSAAGMSKKKKPSAIVRKMDPSEVLDDAVVQKAIEVEKQWASMTFEKLFDFRSAIRGLEGGGGGGEGEGGGGGGGV